MLLEITITPSVLIDLAKERSGVQLQDMAEELGYHKTRITKLRKGECQMTPTEIKYYSEHAGLDFMEVLEAFELQRNPDAESIWRKR